MCAQWDNNVAKLGVIDFSFKNKTSVWGVAGPFLILLALGFFGISMFAVLLTQIQNKNAIKSSKNLFVAVLDERFYRISELVLEYGYWDEAVKNLTVKANPNWIENNFAM